MAAHRPCMGYTLLVALMGVIFLGSLVYLLAQEEAAWRNIRDAQGCEVVNDRLVWQGEAAYSRPMVAWRCRNGTMYWRRAER